MTQSYVLNILFHFNNKTNVIVTDSTCLNAEFFFKCVVELYGVPETSVSLRLNNKKIICRDLTLNGFTGNKTDSLDTVLNNVLNSNIKVQKSFINIEVLGRLAGGKGGFGSLLRGQRGARRKTRSFDACRSLGGHRIRHLKAVDRLTEWLQKQQRNQALVKALGGSESALPFIKSRKTKKFSSGSVGLIGDNSIQEKYFGELESTVKSTQVAVAKALALQNISIGMSSSSSGYHSEENPPRNMGEIEKSNNLLKENTREHRALVLQNRYCKFQHEEESSKNNSDNQEEEEDEEDETLMSFTTCSFQTQFSSLLDKVAFNVK